MIRPPKDSNGFRLARVLKRKSVSPGNIFRRVARFLAIGRPKAVQPLAAAKVVSRTSLKCVLAKSRSKGCDTSPHSKPVDFSMTPAALSTEAGLARTIMQPTAHCYQGRPDRLTP